MVHNAVMKYVVIASVAVLGFAALAFFQSVSWAAEADASQEYDYHAQPPQYEDTRVVAVLFSVGKTKDARKHFGETSNIDLLPINGMPMIKHVFDALCQSSYVHKIIVVAAPETKKALALNNDPRTSFVVDRGDAAENMDFTIDKISKGDLILFVPSDLVLVTPQGLDNLLERVMAEKDVDLFLPMISRTACERAYPEEKRTYAHFEEGQYTGAHVELVRPDLFLDHVDKLEAEKDDIYNIYSMRKNALGMMRFFGLKLMVKYLFGTLSAQDVEQHVFEKYKVTARALYWDDADLSTDLSEPDDIEMVQRVLRQREVVSP
jgi:GTP:adenosylcobinamide-phosphate guanylyltransferase